MTTPPQAPKKPQELTFQGDTRIDDWYWLREKDNPDVIKLLESENDFVEEQTAHTKQLRETLYNEFLSRIQQTDESVPAKRRDGYWYYSRIIEGQQYSQHCRKDADGVEEIFLDENELAKGHDYFDLGGLVISESSDLIAYLVDFDGSERMSLRVKNLTTGELLPDELEDLYYGLAWASDNKTLFYIRHDETMRPYQLWRHELGTPNESDVMVFEEPDERFFLDLGTTLTSKYVIFSVHSKITSEEYLIPADNPSAKPICIEPRSEGIEYGIEHHISEEHGSRFFVVTNADNAYNFKLMVVSAEDPGRANWVEVIPHREDCKLDDVDVFEKHMILSERIGANPTLRVMDLASGDIHEIEQDEEVFTAGPGTNFEFETDKFRFGYTSMITPSSVYEYDLNTREKKLLKQVKVLGDFDQTKYESAREWATAPDGTKIPISLTFKKGLKRDGTAPLFLYGYGSYEMSVDPYFSTLRLSLLDRGFVFAIAHIRGGGEMGRMWYENGKFLNKKNTFTDFIACAEQLVSENYADPTKLVARGGSAGGLLMGAITNLRPDLWRAVLAEVPFVDVLTTMLDEELPLTVTEWEEWGNPNESEFYEYMKSYSPYDNVSDAKYPAMLVTTGLNDPRVSFWEPTKWVQKLREHNKGDQPIYLKVEMGAGHGGPSGRYEAWKDEAFNLAFVLDQVGITS